MLMGGAAEPQTPAGPAWTFAISGDSRNCGDIVMPAIAQGVLADNSAFYWHLGDFRAIYRFDQDYEHLHKTSNSVVLTITDYLGGAWPDFISSQLAPFGKTPIYLGIGNHEAIPPKTHDQVIAQFADWLNAPTIREQRLIDNPSDHEVRTYYHWIQDGIDFITLDNSTSDQFDKVQMAWLRKRLDADIGNSRIRAVVLGMHEALPDSISDDHSMSQSATGVVTGRLVYQWLLDLHKTKPVYLLASHSHFYMEGIYNTAYVKAHGGALPGWIVGTAGAERYPLPAGKDDAAQSLQHIYGYLSARVTDDRINPIAFKFKTLQEKDVPDSVVAKYSQAFVHDCWVNNPVMQQ